MFVKSFVICIIKAALASTAILLLLMAGVAAVFMLGGVRPPPHFFAEMGGMMGGMVLPTLFFILSLVFWLRHQDTRIVRFQDKRILMDRLNSEVAKMRLKEERRSDTFLSFKVPFSFSKKGLSVDFSKPGLATLSGMYFPVKTLQKRLTRQ
jgi:uncharacterized membrane protein